MSVNTLLIILKLLLVLKKAVANKWLNDTMEVVSDVKHHHAKMKTHSLAGLYLMPLCVYTQTRAVFEKGSTTGIFFLQMQ